MTGVFLLTLRELRARKVVLGLFVVATLVWLTMALALQLDVVDGSLAGARLFGQDAAPVTEQVVIDPETGEPVADAEGGLQTEPRAPEFGASLLESLVFGAQAFVAGAAYWVGILLALFATGGLVAALTERGQVDLLLSKPLSRHQVLGGRLLGVAAVTLALVAYILGAVWLVMGIKSGVWNPRFLLAIGVVFGMFAVVYGVVTLVGVWSGSGPLSMIVTVALLFITLVLAIPGLPDQVQRAWRPLVTVPAAILPHFPGVGAGLVPQLATGQPVETLVPFLTSLAFGAACYAGAFFLFARKDL